ncbi:MAG: peptidoglycan DD-metalloendopeptidase family protein [Acidobacteria bacterium]|nr:peptidoglycan DD-metalloendopeptidase family protein [Acidobacteriota bacterium]
MLAAAGPAAQTTDLSRAETEARRVSARVVALQREADRLAGEARTLLGDLRRLEIERDLQIERVGEAQAAVAEAQADVQQITERLATLEAQRVSQLPDLKAQLVDIYKHGRPGSARLLFGATGLRELGRALRASAALVRINEQRIAEHQRTLEALRGERAARDVTVRELQALEADTRRARAAAERAVAARTALSAQIDARRDLNAQFAGELQVAYERLQQQVADLAAGQQVQPVAVPLAPFRGALDWPVAGRVVGRFGQPSGPAGAATARNGIEVAAVEGTPVLAVHPGTVSYADAFTGFGNLVIVDHGDKNYSLYGYLASASVEVGDAVDSGAELGRVGSAPAGPPGLYFEIRIDGRSVDPVQWLRSR